MNLFDLKRNLKLTYKTIYVYNCFLKRINIAIGHIKLEKLQIGHLADLYSQLGESINQQGVSFIATNDTIEYLIKNHTRVEIAEKTGLGINTVYSLFKQKPIRRECCDKIAKVLKVSFKKNFINPRVESFLSNKTIKHHHASISAVLNKAVEWQVIKENVAKYIRPPKVIKTDMTIKFSQQCKSSSKN